MKYTILGFQQEKLIENKLDVNDALLLRAIKDMYSSASMEFISECDVKYMWINYTYLQKQVPIIGSKRSLKRRIKNYADNLLILRILKHNRKGQKGNYSYIAPTIRLDELQDYDLRTKSPKGYDKNGIRVRTKSPNKDTSIKDTSIKDNKDIDVADEINKYKDIFEYYLTFDNLISHQKYRGSYRTAIKKAENELSLTTDEMKNIISRHSEIVKLTKNNENSVHKRGLDELFGQKKYKSTKLICADYLDDGHYYIKYIRDNKKIKNGSSKDSPGVREVV